MSLNKASLKMSQTAPWGWGQAATNATLPTAASGQRSLICLRWHPRDSLALPAPARAKCGPAGPNGAALSLLIFRIRRLEELREQRRSSGCLAPFPGAPSPSPGPQPRAVGQTLLNLGGPACPWECHRSP